MESVVFLTNRAELSEGPLGFGGARSDRLRAGIVRVALDEAVARTKQVFDPEEARALCSMTGSLGGDAPGAVAERIGALRREGQDVLLFVHGFDTDFAQALCYAAQIALNWRPHVTAEANLPRRPQGFTVMALDWAADGGWTNYFRDQADADASGAVVADVLRHVMQQVDLRGRLHLLCQSMGARVLAAAFAQLRHPPLARPPVASMFLSGADMPEGCFLSGQPLAGSDAALTTQGVTVYHNPGDTLGTLSGIVNWRPPLSRQGPDMPLPPHMLEKVNVQATVHPERDRFGHYYVRINPAVVRDAVASIRGLPLAGRTWREALDQTDTVFRLRPTELGSTS